MRNRPHRVNVRLTPESFTLARRRFVAEHGNWQRLLNAAVSAYVMGELRVNPDGSYYVVPGGDEAVVHEGDDQEAVDILDLDSQLLPNGFEELDKPDVLDVRDIARYAEERTGRRVSVSMLRLLLKELAPDYRSNPNAAWRVPVDDPLLDRVAAAVADGKLKEIRDKRFKRAGIKPANLDIDS